MTPSRRAEVLHRLATELLRETAIVSLLSRLGQVSAVGSYRLDVMYRPDIDLILTTEAPSKERAIDTTKLLLDCGHFQTVGFADWLTYRKPNIPRGFYWELIAPYVSDWWKLDVWYMTQEDDISIEAAERFELMLRGNAEARETILDFKARLFDGVKYRYGVTGVEVYDAVLNRKVRSLRSFLRMRRIRAGRLRAHEATNG